MSAFLSYSRANEEIALQIARALRASGIALWVDKLDISAGQHWDSEIHGALRTATHVVVLLSKQSVASSQVLDELGYALETGKRVIPLLLEPCDRPPGIIRLQYIDLAKGLEHTLQELRKALALAPTPPRSTSVDIPGPSPSPVDTAPTPPVALAPRTDPPPVRAPDRPGSRAWIPIAGVGAAVAIGAAIWLSRGGEREVQPAAAPASPTTKPAPVTAASVAAVPSAIVSVPAPSATTALIEPSAVPSVSALAGYRIDVFWCDESGAAAEALAGQIRAQIGAGTQAERVRTRKLSLNQGPWASGYEVRVDPDGSEDRAGRALQQFLATRQPGIGFTGWLSPEATPNYLSVFVCPGARSDPSLVSRTRHF